MNKDFFIITIIAAIFLVVGFGLLTSALLRGFEPGYSGILAIAAGIICLPVWP